MAKSLFLFFFTLLIVQQASAQMAKDTIMYAMGKDGRVAANKDSVDYFMFNIPDPASGLYKVVEINPDGKPKLITYSKSRSFALVMEGPTTTFYPSGRHKALANYQSGMPVGARTNYYPNGQIYMIEKYPAPQKDNKIPAGPEKLLLVECHDSTGKVVAENGNGRWIKFDEGFKGLYEEGTIKNNVENGSWNLIVDGKPYEFEYNSGVVTKPVAYDFKDKLMTVLDVQPRFKDGMDAFFKTLSRTIHYPAIDRENNKQGKVFVTFTVEKDGSLTNVHITKSASKTLDKESIRVIKLMVPWVPGTVAGATVRSEYTIPINYTLNVDNYIH